MKRILHSTAAKVLKMKISAKQSNVILPILCVFVGFIPPCLLSRCGVPPHSSRGCDVRCSGCDVRHVTDVALIRFLNLFVKLKLIISVGETPPKKVLERGGHLS